MPSGSKKRKSAKKTKQDSTLLENATPGDLQAESEESLENQVDPREDNEDGPLTPKTPARDNESETKGSAGMQTDEWLISADQYSGAPTSQATTATVSEENHNASAPIPRADRDNISYVTTSARPDDSLNHPNSSVDAIHEGKAENPGANENWDGLHFGDRSELDSSVEHHNLADRASSLSTERDLAEPFSETSGETFADLESVGQLYVVEPEYTDARTEPPAKENQLTSESLEAVGSKSQEETSTAAVEALGETSADLVLEGQQEAVDLDATLIAVPAEEDPPVGLSAQEKPCTGAAGPPGETSVGHELMDPQGFAETDGTPIPVLADKSLEDLISQEEASGGAFEASEEINTDHTSVISADESAAEWKSQEEMSGGVDSLREPSTDPEFEGQQEGVELNATPLTDERSLESTLQEETPIAMMKAPGETSEDLELEVQQELLNFDSTPLAVLTAESSVELTPAAAVEGPGETIADLELEGEKEDTELEATPGTVPIDESSMELKFQENTSGAAVEDQEDSGLEATSVTVPTDESSMELKFHEDTSGAAMEDPEDNRADLELEDQQEGLELDATSLLAPADESSAELKFQDGAEEDMPTEGMKVQGEASAVLESEGQQEVLNWDDMSFTVPSDESSLKVESLDTSVTTAEGPGEASAELGLEGELPLFEPTAAPRILPSDDSSGDWKPREETSATAVDDFGETSSNRELDSQVEVLELDATPLTLSSDERSLESKSQEDATLTSLETSGEASSDLEPDSQLQASKADATPLIVPTGESLLKAKSQEEKSLTSVEGFGETGGPDLDLDGQPEFLELDATPLPDPTDETSSESKPQDETSATALEPPREIIADLEFKGQLEVSETEATPLIVAPEETSTEFNAEKDTSVVTGEYPVEISLDNESKDQQEVVDLDAEPLTEPTHEIAGALKSQEEKSTGTEGEAGDAFDTSDLQGTMEPSDADGTRQGVLAEESPADQVLKCQGEAPTEDIPKESGEDFGLVGPQKVGTLDDPGTTGLTSLPEFCQGESNSQGYSCSRAAGETAGVDSEASILPEVQKLNCRDSDESQIDDVLGTQGETSAGISEGTEVVYIQEDSQPLLVLDADSNAKQEMFDDVVPESAEAGHSQEESQPPMTVSKSDSDDEHAAFVEFERRGEAVNGIHHGVLNEEAAPCEGMAEPVIDEDGKGLVALRTSSQNLTDTTVPHSMPCRVEGDTSANSIQEQCTPGSTEGEKYVDIKDRANSLRDSGVVCNTAEERNLLPTQGDLSSMVGDDKLPGDPVAGTEFDNEKTQEPQGQAQELNSKGATVPGEQRLESSGMLEDTRGGVATEKLLVRKEEGSARTRELDLGQGNQPVVRQQIHKTKWWECCGIFDALSSKS